MKKSTGILLGFMLVLCSMTRPSLADEGLKTFNLKLKMGLGISSDGDLGSYVSGFDDYGRDFANLLAIQKTGDLEWTKLDRSVGGEFILGISRSIGLGIGIDSLVKNKNSRSEAGPTPYIEANLDVNLKVIPLTLTAYYYLPISQKIHAYIKGGTGYYWGRIKYDLSTFVTGVTSSIIGDIKDRALGFHGGVGIELSVSDNIALVAEGAGRYATFSSWEGDETQFQGSSSIRIKSAPVWYLEEMYDIVIETGKYYPSMYLGEKPVDSPVIKKVRSFNVDFSEFTFQMGIRIGFS